MTTWAVRSAPRTARRQYDTLRPILNAAVAAELIARSPCRGIRLPAVAQATRHVVNADELAALADAVGTCGPMAYLGAVLGLRWGECAGVRVGRLDFLRSTLEVAEQFTRGPRGAMVLGPPKSQAARRTMAVPAALMALLADHLARRGLTGADIDAWVFTAPTAVAWTTRTSAGRRRPPPPSTAWASTTSGGPTPPAWCSTGLTRRPPRPGSATAIRGSLWPSTRRPRCR